MEVLRQTWNTTAEHIQACVENHSENTTYCGTAFVSRDIIAIVDALGEDGLVRFWGRSYNTILGQTLAVMFPDRIGRLLLDSSLATDDYYHDGWLSVNRDTEASLSNFFRECIEAGPALCLLADYRGLDNVTTTPETLMEALAEVLQELQDDPVFLAPEIEARQPEWWFPVGTMTVYYSLKAIILSGIFWPDWFPMTACVIQSALDRDWTMFTDPSVLPPPSSQSLWSLRRDTFHAVACGDAAYRASSPEDAYSLAQAQAAQGSFSDGFSPKVWVCAQWPFRSAERYEGKFEQINTAFPVLFAHSCYDPITPLSGSWDAASRFRGSRLLVHEGHGHGVMNHRSNCTIDAIQSYFAKGELPAHGTVCEPNMNGFEQAAQDVAAE